MVFSARSISKESLILMYIFDFLIPSGSVVVVVAVVVSTLKPAETKGPK